MPPLVPSPAPASALLSISANTEYPTLRKREDAHRDRYPTREPAGKVVWYENRRHPRAARAGEWAGTTVRSDK